MIDYKYDLEKIKAITDHLYKERGLYRLLIFLKKLHIISDSPAPGSISLINYIDRLKILSI